MLKVNLFCFLVILTNIGTGISADCARLWPMPDHQSRTMLLPTRYNRSGLIHLANSCTTLPIIDCVTWDTLRRLGLCAKDPTP